MRLTQIVSTALNGATARLRRDAIGYALCAVCAVAAIIMATSASVLALEPHVGVIYARLIVAGAFVLIALATVVWLKVANGRRAAPVPLTSRADTTQRSAQFAQLAMIVEAVMLGYSLSRRSERR